MRKKLLLARELLHEPELLLLDEPTANLDVHSTELIRHIIQGLAKRGVTVLITTHNMPEVEQVCDRVAIINRGRLLALDSPTGFKARNTERVVDVVLERDGGHERLAVNLTDDVPAARVRPAARDGDADHSAHPRVQLLPGVSEVDRGRVQLTAG